MKPRKKQNLRRMRRAARVSARLHGTAETPRLVVTRTNRYIYAQLIDDDKGHTLVASSTIGVPKAKKTAQSFAAGETLGKAAAGKGIKRAIFDRRSSKFHGRVRQFAEGVQKGGLKI
jgi:large subunit ribosomal protein L18